MISRWIIFTVIFVSVSCNSENVPFIPFNTLQILNHTSKSPNITDECSKHLQGYLNELQKYDPETWAEHMYDSSAQTPDGLFSGKTKFLGYFDECISISVNDSFVGKHCMLNIDVQYKSPDQSDHQSNVEKKVSLFYALCLPSSCNAFKDQIENDFIVLDITLDNENCWKNEVRALGAGGWCAIAFLIIIAVAILTLTLYDYVRKGAVPIIKCFSIYTNGKELFRIRQHDIPPSSNGEDVEETEAETSTTRAINMVPMNSIRFLSMTWLILWDSYIFAGNNGPVSNYFNMEKLLRDRNHVAIINGLLCLDTIFFLSGFQRSVNFFYNRKYDIPRHFITVYLREAPAFAIMMLVQAVILPNIARGPLWHSIADPAAGECRTSWWSGLLFLQNYVHPHSTCLGQSWFLSAEMQMFWVTPLVLFPMIIWSVYGYLYIGILIALSIMTTLIVGFVKDLGPSYLVTTVPYIQTSADYVTFHSRATPWLIGITIGYAFSRLKAPKNFPTTNHSFKWTAHIEEFFVIIGKKITEKGCLIIAWLSAIGFCLGSLYGIVYFTDRLPEIRNDLTVRNTTEPNYTTAQAAFYLSLHRVGWSLGIAWLVYAILNGHAEFIKKILSWAPFRPLANLAFGTFLSHGLIQVYIMGTQKSDITFKDSEMIYYFTGTWAWSNLISVLVVLLVEFPISRLEQYFLNDLEILKYDPFPDSATRRDTTQRR